MEPISLILIALSTGATAIASQVGSDLAIGLYDRLKGKLRTVLADDDGGRTALVQYEDDPDTWRRPLEVKLAKAGAAGDPEILEGARALLAELDPQGTASGKYQVAVSHSQGVQVGDHNTQRNDFR